MADRGAKRKYSDKQLRLAKQLERQYLEQGVALGEAVRLAWEAVRNQSQSERSAVGQWGVSKSVEQMLRSDAAKKGWNKRRQEAS